MTSSVRDIAQMKKVIPETVTPKELADATGWSERWVRQTARALNACIGRARGMRLTEQDVIRIMEAKRGASLMPTERDEQPRARKFKRRAVHTRDAQ